MKLQSAFLSDAQKEARDLFVTDFSVSTNN